MNNLRAILKRIFDELKSIFISGLLTILPMALSIALFSFTFKLIKNWSNPVYIILPESLKTFAYSGIIVVLLTILIVGVILKYFLLHPLIDFLERHLFGNIPLFRQVYFGIKQLIKTLSPSSEVTEQVQSVVLVEFPRPGIYCIGLVTGVAPVSMVPSIAHEQGPVYYNVFVPTTPNPTTGFFFIVSEHDCKQTTLTRQEAMTLVISGGIIQPERYTKQ